MPKIDSREFDTNWNKTRHGAWAGRGFHYQHLITTLILIRQWAGLFPAGYVVPEGLEDCVIELPKQDVWLQTKSRESGLFGKTEIEEFLEKIKQKSKNLSGHKKIKASLILEQPCKEFPEHNIDLLFDGSKCSLLICNNPGSLAFEILKQEIESADTIIESLLSNIYQLAVKTAAENATTTYKNRRRISTTEIEKLILDHLKSHDPSAINEAIISKFIEPVDFSNKIHDPAFYQGVRVQPGHISANLVIDRPKEIESALLSLKSGRSTLISGPSGAGKSALVWLTVVRLYIQIRWFKIGTNVSPQNANAIVNFITSRRPRIDSPIGIVFDDVNSTNSNLWDILANELQGISNTYLIGSIRREDVELLSQHSDINIIEIKLNEALAEQLWKKLQADTEWPHWREPFEMAEGLLLEYVHILTKGKRLKELIKDQIRQREKEQRTDELVILRAASTLFMYRAEIDVQRLFQLLKIPSENGYKALKRLIDEHLVKETQPGVLGGLHPLRSDALSESTHDGIVYLKTNSIWQSIRASTYDSLPHIIRLILSDKEQFPENVCLEKLCDILSEESNIELWISVFTGLGFATLEKYVDQYIKALVKNNVPPSLYSLASMWIDVDVEMNELEAFEQWTNIRKAVSDFRAESKRDLRLFCLEVLLKEVKIPEIKNIYHANRFFSSLVSTVTKESIDISIDLSITGDGDINIKEVSNLLCTLYMLNPKLAEGLVNSLGGEKKLLELFYAQNLWVTKPAFEVSDDGGKTIRSNLYFIDDGIQKNTNDEMVRICETLISITPSASKAACDYIDPMGRPVKFGLFSLSKNMPRKNLPAKSRIAWNVAFRQIFFSRTHTITLTEYAHKVCELTKRTEKVFRQYTEHWIRGGYIAQIDQLANEMISITTENNTLVYAAPNHMGADMTKPSQNNDEEPSGSLISGILENLIPRISKMNVEEHNKGTAGFAGGLADQANQQKNSIIWRAHKTPPIHELEKIEERLLNISHIIHELDFRKDKSFVSSLVKAAKKGGPGKAVSTAARYCRDQAHTRFNKKLALAKKDLQEKGWKIQSSHKATNDRADTYWPAYEIAFLVEISDFEKQSNWIEEIISIAEKSIENQYLFCVVPIFNNKAVPDLAMHKPMDTIFPYLDFREKWKSEIHIPFLECKISDAFDHAIAAAQRISAILYCKDENQLADEEYRLFKEASDQIVNNHKILESAWNETQVDVFQLAFSHLSEILERLNEELDFFDKGEKISNPLWRAQFDALTNVENEQVRKFAGIRILLRNAESYF